MQDHFKMFRHYRNAECRQSVQLSQAIPVQVLSVVFGLVTAFTWFKTQTSKRCAEKMSLSSTPLGPLPSPLVACRSVAFICFPSSTYHPLPFIPKAAHRMHSRALPVIVHSRQYADFGLECKEARNKRSYAHICMPVCKHAHTHTHTHTLSLL